MPEPHSVALARIVEQRGRQHVRIVVPGGQEARDDVERVTSVRNRHGTKESRAGRWEDPVHDLLLGGIDAGANVGDELPDPMHR